MLAGKLTGPRAGVPSQPNREGRPIMRQAFAVAVVMAAITAGVAYAGDGADGSTFFLTSYDGTTLTALNDQNHSFIAQFGSTTTFKAAALDKYIPTDPYKAACGQAAANYNGALLVATSDGGAGVRSAIASLASLRCKAKVVFVPSDPYIPG